MGIVRWAPGEHTRNRLRDFARTRTVRAVHESVAPAADGSWPLRGRDEEIEAVRAVIDAGGLRTVVVRGPAGVGKTRLLREVASSAELIGHSVRWIIGSPLVQHVALGALAEFLPPEIVGADPVALAAHARRELRHGIGDEPAVVCVDDAHLLDRESAAVVHQLCLSEHVVVVCAARSEPRVPLITALCRLVGTKVLELQPLGPDDVAAMVADVLGGPVQPSTASVFYDRSAGGALFLHELVEDARRAGALRCDPVGWRLQGQWAPGTRLLDLVYARSQRDDDVEDLALDIVAVGEPVSLGVLLGLVPEPVLEQLERERLLEVRRDGRRSTVAFAHPLHGEARRDRLSSVAARRHRLLLADAVHDTGRRRRGDLLTIAIWRLDGGALDGDEWLLAAQRALALRHRASIDLAERAVATSGSTIAWTVLGETRTVARDLSGAMAAFEAARAAATTDHDIATVVSARARSAYWVGQEVETAIDDLVAAEAVIGDEASRALLGAQRVSILVNSGRTREGVELADRLVSEGLLAPDLNRWVMSVAANGLAFLGETARARSIASALMAEPAPSIPTHLSSGSPATTLVIADILGGDLRSADDLLRLAAEMVQDPENAGFVATLHGRLALWQGKPRTAMERLERGREGLAAGMSPWRSTWCDALCAEAAALAGLPSGPIQVSLGATNEVAHRFLALDTMRAEATRRAATGDVTGARSALRIAGDEAFSRGLLAAAMLSHYERFRLRDVGADDDVLALADQVDGAWSASCAAHVRAWRDGDASALLTAVRSFASSGATLFAAECAADAAVTARRAGDATAARRADAVAHELRLGGEACWSPRLGPLDSATPLTPREHEIALMAAGGDMSTREIAGRLGVAVRTVEGHLLRIYTKVGVGSRKELAKLFAVDREIQVDGGRPDPER